MWELCIITIKTLCNKLVVKFVCRVLDTETRVYSYSSNIVTAVQLIIDTATKSYSRSSNLVIAVNVLQKCFVFCLLKCTDQCITSHCNAKWAEIMYNYSYGTESGENKRIEIMMSIMIKECETKRFYLSGPTS